MTNILAVNHTWKCPWFLTFILPVPEVILRGNAAYFFSVFYGIGGSGFASKIGFIKYSWEIFSIWFYLVNDFITYFRSIQNIKTIKQHLCAIKVTMCMWKMRVLTFFSNKSTFFMKLTFIVSFKFRINLKKSIDIKTTQHNNNVTFRYSSQPQAYIKIKL